MAPSSLVTSQVLVSSAANALVAALAATRIDKAFNFIKK
jgi:hypothetical protein